MRPFTYDAMVDILQGSVIGKIVQDRQALMQLVAEMRNKKVVTSVFENTAPDLARGTRQAAFDLVAETPSHKAEIFAAEKANSMQAALDKVNPLIGAAADGFSALAHEFPSTTAAVLALSTAATAAAAALAAHAGIGTLLGRGKAAADIAASVAGAGSGGRAMTGGRALYTMSKALPLSAWGTMGAAGVSTAASGVLTAGAVGYGAGAWVNDKYIQGTDIGDKIGEAVARALAAFGHEDAKRALEINLSIDGQQIAAVVNSVNGQQARRS